MKARRRAEPTPEPGVGITAAQPLTPGRWQDFVRLFGTNGACGGCWCMMPRLEHADFEARKGAGAKLAMHKLVKAGEVPGLVGYRGEEPVAWCAIDRRERFLKLRTSRILAPVDARPVWSIVCLFVRRDLRGQGVSAAMIAAAAAFAKSRGATLVEAYPVEPAGRPIAAAFAHMGLASAYRRAGFAEVARRSPTRPIVRLET